MPKITDFGLAKQTGSADGPTQTGAILGTPSYMAPEQASGHSRDVGPPVDIYALGSILYELLTGRPPFRAETPLDTIMQAIRQEPVPPRQLQPKCPRDLETIALKCLQKEPQKRYATAGKLADDLQRFIDGKPILARPISPLGRSWRWAKRNPAVAGLLAILFLVLSGGLVATSLALVRAEREHKKAVAQEARAKANLLKAVNAVDRMMTRVADEQLKYVPQFEDERRKILEEAAAFYDDFLQQETDDPVLRRESARTYSRLSLTFQELGRTQKALDAAEQAIRLQEELLKQDPTDAGLKKELAETLRGQGTSYRMLGRIDMSGRSYRQALDLSEGLLREHPTEPASMESAAESLRALAYQQFQVHDINGGESIFFGAALVCDQLVKFHPQNIDFKFKQARAYYDLAFFHSNMGRMPQAEQEARKAISLLEPLLKSAPDRANETEIELARCRLTLALVLSETNRAIQVGAELEPALVVFERLVRDYPLSPVYRLQLAQALHISGLRQALTAKPAEAAIALDRAIELLEKLDREHPEMFANGIYLRRVYEGRSRFNLGRGKLDLAIADLDRCIKQAWDQWQRIVPGSISPYIVLVDYVRVLQRLATVLRGAGKHAEAIDRLSAGIENLQKHTPDQPGYRETILSLRVSRAFALTGGGDYRAATAEAAALDATAGTATHRYNCACVYSLAAAATRNDKAAKEDVREHFAAECLTHAGAAIRLLHAKGYFQPKEQVEHFWKDSDLDALRADPEFRRWLDQNLPQPKDAK